MVNAIKSLAQSIVDGFVTALKTLFIPSNTFFDNKITPIMDMFYSKLPFLEQMKNIFSSFISAIGSSSSDVPEFTFTYKGATYNIFDFSIYQPYRSTVHAIILFISYFYFIRKTLRRLPSTIGGI